MAPATKHLLLLIGTILLAQRATAQFDYNTTWLGTVLAFVNVSIIPGEWLQTASVILALRPGCFQYVSHGIEDMRTRSVTPAISTLCSAYALR